ncbi:flagellar export chaperone FliS [Alkalihalobacillus pseudalcaliphilus]|uniref:flagellar export chaperone FliS n=1 Tax=Alkalihalobacillus pseudalcaliphilus TaxID=79884 RepID=UPI00064D9810|nr:flagellar export chaperone FliS [Alkalihalobacillus pseudalcaliphilus]KMK76041.1 flagellar biosynthesis protein FliS [Alkalihalobacillus pseudalcaliphilus]
MVGRLSEEWVYQKSSQEITSLLYEGCIIHLEDAIAAFEAKDYVEVNIKLQKASDILVRLGSGLNYEAGIITDQLEQLYQYMTDQLFIANLHKNKQKVEEVISILETIMSAWQTALVKGKDQESAMIKSKKNRYEKHAIYES